MLLIFSYLHEKELLSKVALLGNWSDKSPTSLTTLPAEAPFPPPTPQQTSTLSPSSQHYPDRLFYQIHD